MDERSLQSSADQVLTRQCGLVRDGQRESFAAVVWFGHLLLRSLQCGGEVTKCIRHELLLFSLLLDCCLLL